MSGAGSGCHGRGLSYQGRGLVARGGVWSPGSWTGLLGAGRGCRGAERGYSGRGLVARGGARSPGGRGVVVRGRQVSGDAVPRGALWVGEGGLGPPASHNAPRPSASSFPSTTSMDQYIVLGRIGEGAHGVVFKAKDREVGAGPRGGGPVGLGEGLGGLWACRPQPPRSPFGGGGVCGPGSPPKTLVCVCPPQDRGNGGPEEGPPAPPRRGGAPPNPAGDQSSAGDRGPPPRKCVCVPPGRLGPPLNFGVPPKPPIYPPTS